MKVPTLNYAHVRLVIAVVALLGLLAGLFYGLGHLVVDGRPLGTRVAGGGLVAGSVAGIVVLLLWARGSSWQYDRPRDGVSASEMFLVGSVAIVLCALLVEPLGPAGLLIALILPTSVIAWMRFRRVRLVVLALGPAGTAALLLGFIAGVILWAQLFDG